jgi:type VI secretion system protein ImpJ
MRRAGGDEVEFGDHADASLARYSTTESEVRDSNSGSDQTAPVQLGNLRMRLMRKRDAPDAYTTLGVVQVTERRVDNQVVLQKAYIPPMLHASNDGNLGSHVRELHGLLHQRGEALGSRISQPGRGGVSEVADFMLLQTINRYEPVFAHLVVHQLLHPERFFSTCLALAGELATFSQSGRRPPRYPDYLHDDLAQCFAPLMADLRNSLSMVLEQNAMQIELQERQYGVRVAIIPDLELLKSASLVLAVNAQLASEVVRTRFPTQVKIGSVDKIRDLVNLQLPGIPLLSLPVAPRQIPYHAGFNYFELERGGELWAQLERSGGMAMHIAGEFPGLELEFWAIRS